MAIRRVETDSSESVNIIDHTHCQPNEEQDVGMMGINDDNCSEHSQDEFDRMKSFHKS
jgi:hypothetical protein